MSGASVRPVVLVLAAAVLTAGALLVDSLVPPPSTPERMTPIPPPSTPPPTPAPSEMASRLAEFMQLAGASGREALAPEILRRLARAEPSFSPMHGPLFKLHVGRVSLEVSTTTGRVVSARFGTIGTDARWRAHQSPTVDVATARQTAMRVARQQLGDLLDSLTYHPLNDDPGSTVPYYYFGWEVRRDERGIADHQDRLFVDVSRLTGLVASYFYVHSQVQTPPPVEADTAYALIENALAEMPGARIKALTLVAPREPSGLEHPIWAAYWSDPVRCDGGGAYIDATTGDSMTHEEWGALVEEPPDDDTGAGARASATPHSR